MRKSQFILLGLVLLLFSSMGFAQTFKTPEELADANGAFVDVNGVRLYYTSAGDPADPAVILIHGFGGSTFTWRDVQPALAEAGFYSVALDLPPFGLSDKNPDVDYSRSGMADSVVGLMDNLGIASATIVGHSMGGAVTAQVAVRHPERAERLVFVAGGIFEVLQSSDAESTPEAQSASPLSILASIDPRSPVAPILLRSLIDKNFFATTLASAAYKDEVITEAMVEGYLRFIEIEDAPVGFLAYTQAVEANPISLENLVTATGDKSVLLLWGVEDTWVELRLGETMHAALSNSQLLTYEGIGHLPMEEDLSAFNRDLIAFLQAN